MCHRNKSTMTQWNSCFKKTICTWVTCETIPGFVSVKPSEDSWRCLGVGGSSRDWKGQPKGHVLTGQLTQWHKLWARNLEGSIQGQCLTRQVQGGDFSSSKTNGSFCFPSLVLSDITNQQLKLWTVKGIQYHRKLPLYHLYSPPAAAPQSQNALPPPLSYKMRLAQRTAWVWVGLQFTHLSCTRVFVTSEQKKSVPFRMTWCRFGRRLVSQGIAHHALLRSQNLFKRSHEM